MALPGRLAAAAAALVMAVTLGGCGFTVSGPAEPTPTLVSGEYNHLDASGIATIEESGHARLDMRSGTLMKSDANLTDDSTAPAVSTKDGSKISITLDGPDGPVLGRSDKMRFMTVPGQPDFSEVTFFLTADSWDEYVGLIREGVRQYGLDSDSAERWITSVGADQSGKSDFAIGPGTSPGLAVTYDLRFDGSKDTQVIIVHVNDLNGTVG